jgi:hypothetical protein
MPAIRAGGNWEADMNEQIARELREVVPDDRLRDEVVVRIREIDKVAARTGDAALERNLLAEGGQAFLWEDLLSLEEAAGLLASVGSLTDFGTQAELLVKLVLFWRKLRGVRVALDGDEYRVMKAVKRGADSVEQVAQKLGWPADRAHPVVDRLKAKRYRGDIMLLEESDGALSTEF